jgi:hypothetical protein
MNARISSRLSGIGRLSMRFKSPVVMGLLAKRADLKEHSI